MSTARVAIACLLVACSSNKAPDQSPPAPPSPAPLVEKPPAACLPKVASEIGVAYAFTDGPTEATVCFGGHESSGPVKNECLRIDREGKATGGRTWPNALAALHSRVQADPPTVTLEGRTVRTCPGGSPCIELQIPPVKSDPDHPPHGVATASLSRLFLLIPEPIPGRSPAAFIWYGDTYDLKTKQRLAHVRIYTRLDDLPFRFHTVEARFLGDGHVVLTEQLDPSGKSVSLLLDPIEGTALFLTDGTGWVADIDETTLAVLHDTQVTLIDAMSLKAIGTFTAPGKIGAVVPWIDRILVVHFEPAGTLQLDPKTATAYTSAPLPICK